MRPVGYTLIELLVVISIISLMAIIGFANFKDFSRDQVVVKAAGQVQSLLRLAQSNATSSTLCNGSGATSWYINITDDANNSIIQLNCDPGGTLRSYPLENAKVSIAASGCSFNLPVRISYAVGTGAQTLASSGASDTCLKSSKFTLTITNFPNPSASPKSFNVSKGGAIDVQ